VKRVGIVALVLGLGYVIIALWDRDALVRWMSEVSPVPFFAAMAVLPAVGVPLSPFLVVAGATFGFWIGLGGSIVAVAINLCLAYAIANTKLRPRLQSLFERFDYKVPDFTTRRRSAWRFALAIKLTPALPASVKMYVLAVTAVPFSIYFGVSLTITIAFAFAWIALGDSLLAHDLSHVTVAAIAVAILTAVAVVWWWKRRGVSGGGEPSAA